LTRAQQQRELEKRIAHAQESQVAHVNAYLVDVWRRETIRWKNAERVAARRCEALIERRHVKQTKFTLFDGTVLDSSLHASSIGARRVTWTIYD